MTKYRFTLTAIALSLLFLSCKKENQFSITGRVTHANQDVIYLEELKVSSTELIDSAKINSDGKFELKAHTSIPTFYLLKLSDNNFVTLLIDSAESVIFSADAIDFSRDYLVEGSPGSKQVQELKNKLDDTKQKLDSIKSLDILNSNKPNYKDLREKLQAESSKIIKEQVDYSTS